MNITDISNIITKNRPLTIIESKTMVEVFEADSKGKNDLLPIFSSARNFITRYDRSIDTIARLHLCAQRYIYDIIDFHPESQNILSSLYYDELKYYVSQNEYDKCIELANRLLEICNRDYSVYARTLGQAVDSLLQIGMHEEVKPFLKRLELYVSTHYISSFDEYTLIANCVYAFAYLKDTEKYEYYLNKLNELDKTNISSYGVYFRELYKLASIALLNPENNNDKFEAIFKKTLNNFSSENEGSLDYILADQSFLLIPIFKKAWKAYDEERMVYYVSYVKNLSSSTAEKLKYYNFLFERMHISGEKYPELWKDYFICLKEFRRLSQKSMKDKVRDEMVRSEVERKYRHQAEIDELSKLSNRYLYETKLNEIRSRRKIPDNLTLVIADLNNLKNTNDRYGHVAGDEIIVALAQFMNKIFESYGHTYRVGGDEFISIINIEEDELYHQLYLLDLEIDDWKGMYNNKFTVSIGTSSARELGDNCKIEELIKLADDRMYENKYKFHNKNKEI